MNRVMKYLLAAPEGTSHYPISEHAGTALADLPHELFDAIYSELRERIDRNLWQAQATAPKSSPQILEQAYSALQAEDQVTSLTRSRFFVVGSRILRWIVVDEAARLAERRAMPRNIPLIEVDRALDVLAAIDSQMAQIVELKFFGGLTRQQISQALFVEKSKVDRSWTIAQRWLRSRLQTL